MKLSLALVVLSAIVVVSHGFIEGSLCGSKRFTCRSIKKCVGLSKRCDGCNDCGDNSDEAPKLCEKLRPGHDTPLCGTGRFTCRSVMKCVSCSKKCNGINDCGDNSDEADC